MLSSELNVREHFAAQSKLLEQKAETLLEASRKLKQLTMAATTDESIPWESIIKSIEVFRMTQRIEDSWVGKVLTADELNLYVKFAKGLDARFTATEKQQNEAVWADLLKEIQVSLKLDPASEQAKALARRILNWVKQLYGKEFASLRLTIWEKGFKGGPAAAEKGLSAEAVTWIDQAVQAFYKEKTMAILSQSDKMSSEELARLWNDLLEERYCDSEPHKQKFTRMVLDEFEINHTAREFLLSR